MWAHGPVDDWRLRGTLPDAVDLIDLTGAPEGLAGRVAMTGVVVAFRREPFRRDFVAAHGSWPP